MDYQSEVMREQMQNTRTSLQDKLETLEQQVKDTVLETTEVVSGTVEAVQETVESVKETVQETVQSVKNAVNLNYMVNEHPWAMFAGAVAVGFVSARLFGLGSSTNNSSVEPKSTAPRPETALDQTGFSVASGAAQAAAPPQRTWWSSIADHYSEELAKVKGLAFAAVGSAVCEIVAQNAIPEIAARTKDLVDGFVTKLGAKPIGESILKAGSAPVDSGNLSDKAF